ncbi:MAG: major capsid protein P2 [Kiloniellales bacterium]
MSRLLKKMPNGSGIGAGQTATFNLPLGLSYHQLLIRMSADPAGGVAFVDIAAANWAGVLGEIRLLIDGSVKIRADAADLVSLWQYYGQTIANGVLPIFLGRPWQRTAQGEDAPAYGTAGVQSMTLEIDIVAGIAIERLELYAQQGPNMPLGDHYVLRQFPFGVGNLGLRELSDLPRGAFGMLGMHINTDDISMFQLEANQRIIREADRALASAVSGQTGKTFQTGWTHIDLTVTDRLSDMLVMALEDFRVKVTMTGTGNFKLYAEQVFGMGKAGNA